MVFIDLLKVHGLSKEKAIAITKDMYQKRIFITYEEKIEERYKKLKHQRDDLRVKLDLAEQALKKLAESYQASRDIAINAAIQAMLADAKYPELLIDKFDKSVLSVEADGTIAGLKEQLSNLKRAYGDLFPILRTGQYKMADTKGGEEVSRKHDKLC